MEVLGSTSCVGLSRAIYERQWCASNHSISERVPLGTSDVLLCVSNILQSALESRQEARIVKIDFSAASGRGDY